MNLCIPIEKNNGMESEVFGHFGSAPFFMFYNTETEESKTITNNNDHYSHGACLPVQALNSNPVDAVLVGGIGARAVNLLNNAGIKVFRSVQGLANENIKKFTENSLEEIKVESACQQHGCH
ncbi:MAG: NifB/NifX family molybdenum-iron cluster-binding protein [Candidatus Cloacimonetes bacterium]|nr:NifB/NifX family molybdenum-iron cluster-binding protein [Candidatus Cloacimonadota bacterium]